MLHHVQAYKRYWVKINENINIYSFFRYMILKGKWSSPNKILSLLIKVSSEFGVNTHVEQMLFAR